jgi:hypothetical protein
MLLFLAFAEYSPIMGYILEVAMPIKVFFPKSGDPYIEAASLEDALDLVKQSSNGHGTQQPMRFPRLETSSDDVTQFFLTINENARKLLLALLKHDKGVRGEQFSDETGIASEKFGGIFGGASKIAKKYGLNIKKFVGSEMIVSGTDRYRYFKPGKLLLENAEKFRQAAKEGIRD